MTKIQRKRTDILRNELGRHVQTFRFFHKILLEIFMFKVEVQKKLIQNVTSEAEEKVNSFSTEIIYLETFLI